MLDRLISSTKPTYLFAAQVKCVRVALKDRERTGRPKPMRIYGFHGLVSSKVQPERKTKPEQNPFSNQDVSIEIIRFVDFILIAFPDSVCFICSRNQVWFPEFFQKVKIWLKKKFISYNERSGIFWVIKPHPKAMGRFSLEYPSKFKVMGNPLKMIEMSLQANRGRWVQFITNLWFCLDIYRSSKLLLHHELLHQSMLNPFKAFQFETRMIGEDLNS